MLNMRRRRDAGWRVGIAVLVGVASAAGVSPGPAAGAEEVVAPIEVVDTKAVYGTVETRNIVPARARIGGTLVSLEIERGSRVRAGEVVAVVGDQKLALQLQAVEARLRAVESEQANAKVELERALGLAQRGSATQQRVDQQQTQVDILTNRIAAARAERAVVLQQTAEGQVLAPATGRVLAVPVTRGAVVMPGEAVATVAGGGFYLRLALPERHAPLLKEGANVEISTRTSLDKDMRMVQGRLAKVYPQIEGGRVIADVEVEGLGDYFVGERTLVRVPIATRRALTVPPKAIVTRSGIDFATLATPAGPREVAVVVGPKVSSEHGERVEILSGLRDGDRVIVP